MNMYEELACERYLRCQEEIRERNIRITVERIAKLYQLEKASKTKFFKTLYRGLKNEHIKDLKVLV